MIKKWKRFLEGFDSDLKDKIEFLLYPQLDNLDSDWEIRSWIDIHEEKWAYKIGWIIETKQRDVLSNIDISKFESDYICEVKRYTITISEIEIIKSEDKIYDIIFDGNIERINELKEYINILISELQYGNNKWRTESGWVFINSTRGLICSYPRWWNLLQYKGLMFHEIKSLTKFIVEDRFEITAKNVSYFS
jgi:hypothetical protein